MPKQRTLAIIKPNAVKNGHTDSMVDQIKKAGFEIKDRESFQLALSQAQDFYQVHAARPFYQDLCRYIASGTIVAMVLEKENAIADFRALIGATDPKQAARSTLRAQFGTSIDHNAVHGSDAEDTAKKEIFFFFPK